MNSYVRILLCYEAYVLHEISFRYSNERLHRRIVIEICSSGYTLNRSSFLSSERKLLLPY
jgi:hypothetical protein